MRRARFVLLLALLALAPTLLQPQQAAVTPDSVAVRIQELLQELSEITGWKVKRHVPYRIIGREELEAFLNGRIEKEIDPDEIRVEELRLKRLGLAPPEFDLKQSFVDLYTEQAAALYDYREKTLFLLESDDDLMQDTLLAHELAHALADQHFRLDRYTEADAENDDAAMARLAAVEGQATWLMAELSVRRLGRSLTTSPELAVLIGSMIAGPQGEFPVFDGAPRYLRESLIFPYFSGIAFQQAVITRLGQKGFSEVFRRAPASTQEILHPEKYSVRRKTAAPKLPNLRGQGNFRKLAEGTLGEFDYGVLLAEYAGDETARRIAPEWTGGRYRLLEHKRDGRVVLVHAARWANREAARDFYDQYRKVLEGKWSRVDFSHLSEERMEGWGDDGFFRVHLQGLDVYSFEGTERPEDLPDLR